MLRTRIPGGRLNADQLDCIAGVIRDFGNGWDGHTEPDRFGEITTRQDIQVPWISFDQLPEVWRRYDAVGLTSAQACGDSMRNPTACPGRRRRPARLPARRAAARGVPDVRDGQRADDGVPAAQVEGRGDGLPDGLRGGEAPLPRVHARAAPLTGPSGSTRTSAAACRTRRGSPTSSASSSAPTRSRTRSGPRSRSTASSGTSITRR